MCGQVVPAARMKIGDNAPGDRSWIPRGVVARKERREPTDAARLPSIGSWFWMPDRDMTGFHGRVDNAPEMGLTK